VVNGGYPNAVNDELMQNFKNVLTLKKIGAPKRRASIANDVIIAA
jgi:hypothetical protein